MVIAPNPGSLERLLKQFPADRYYVSREAALRADAVGIVVTQASDLDVAYVERWVRTLGLEVQWEEAKSLSAPLKV